MAENSTRILIVDDHPFVREGLKQLLAAQADYSLIGEASNIQEAQQAFSRQVPDVAVIDQMCIRDRAWEARVIPLYDARRDRLGPWAAQASAESPAGKDYSRAATS